MVPKVPVVPIVKSSDSRTSGYTESSFFPNIWTAGTIERLEQLERSQKKLKHAERKTTDRRRSLFRNSRQREAAGADSIDGVFRRGMEALAIPACRSRLKLDPARPARLRPVGGEPTSLFDQADGQRRRRVARSSENSVGPSGRPLHGRAHRPRVGARFSGARKKLDHGRQRFRPSAAAGTRLCPGIASLAGD